MTAASAEAVAAGDVLSAAVRLTKRSA